MYKFVFLLLLLLVLTAFSFICKVKDRMEISSPVIAGSPILVLNQ